MTSVKPIDENEENSFHSKLRPEKDIDSSCTDMCPNCYSTCYCCMTFGCLCFWCPCSPYFRTVNENESLVVQFWGKLWREIPQPGIHFINPCGYQENRISLKQESIDLKNVKVVDAKGNPVVVSAIVRYRVVNAILAALEVSDYKKYIENQASAVLKQICSKYPYYTFDDSPSLKSEAKAIQEDMVKALQTPVKNCGAIVLAVDLNEMSYASEIAGMMLIRQQAEARVEARDVIVVGAVGIVSKAMQRLEQTGQRLTDQERSKTVSNLLTVLCSDSAAQPVIPTNT